MEAFFTSNILYVLYKKNVLKYVINCEGNCRIFDKNIIGPLLFVHTLIYGLVFHLNLRDKVLCNFSFAPSLDIMITNY